MPYLARTPCVPLFCTSFNRVGNKERFRLPGAGGGSFPLYGGTFAPKPRKSLKKVSPRVWKKSQKVLSGPFGGGPGAGGPGRLFSDFFGVRARRARQSLVNGQRVPNSQVISDIFDIFGTFGHGLGGFKKALRGVSVEAPKPHSGSFCG